MEKWKAEIQKSKNEGEKTVDVKVKLFVGEGWWKN